MKRKTSITLSEDLLEAIDKRSGDAKNRSGFIEMGIRSYIAKLLREEKNAKDLAIINRHADRLNIEATDVLAFQVIP
jgi:metal-responsive CopG/Arc/MetJ family transcriptional regulator